MVCIPYVLIYDWELRLIRRTAVFCERRAVGNAKLKKQNHPVLVEWKLMCCEHSRGLSSHGNTAACYARIDTALPQSHHRYEPYWSIRRLDAYFTISNIVLEVPSVTGRLCVCVRVIISN